jgi:hypothetical protein
VTSAGRGFVGIGTPEALAVLKTLARGLPEARLTREACGSLERLTKLAKP